MQIPDNKLLKLKELCDRMMYYCDHAHFGGSDITLWELHNFLDYYCGQNTLVYHDPSSN